MELSFDDGPNEIWTPQILDLLAAHDVKATFFVVGRTVDESDSPGIARMAADGHVVGNHTWTHHRMTGLTDGQVLDELERTNECIQYWTGSAPTVWRAPYFGRDERIDGLAATLGLEHVGADIVPEDCFTNDAALIAERVLESARNSQAANPVVCLHDGIPPDGGSASCTKSRQPTVDALRIILETLA